MTATDFDPWQLTSSPERDEDGFRKSLVDRARKRTVTFVASDGDWAVSGSKSLGDSRSTYAVTFDAGTKKYDCQCFHSDHGDARRKAMCSHVLAVILHRKDNASDPNATIRTRTTATPATEPSTARQGSASSPPVLHASVATPVVVTPSTSACPLPSDPRFGLPPMPAHFATLRPHQWDAITEIVEAFETKDLVFLNAPVGSGKTLVGEIVRRMMDVPTAYICSSIQLQAQILSDFPYAREIKGKSNYATADGPEEVSCADCTAAPPATPDCMWCDHLDRCPYRVAKTAAVKAPFAVLNTSYFLHVTNHAKEFTDRGLVICDEADTLEGNLMGFVEVTIGRRLMEDLELGQPRFVTKPESWEEWLNVIAIPRISRRLAQIPKASDDVQTIRLRNSLSQLVEKLKVVAAGVTDGNWIFDDYQSGRATFRPITVDKYGKANLWAHGQKWLLMSGTIISPDQMAESLGWERDFAVVNVPMTFPVENRKINVVPVASMTRKNQETAWPEMANALCNLADIHAKDRMLVHTVSYALTDHLAAELRAQGFDRRVMTYKAAGERERVLARFKKTPGAILLAPSMDRGVDVPECDVVVVVKSPFLSLGDKQVAARLHAKGGQQWYSVESIRSLVQMTGRHVRSNTDVGVTYILDSIFLSNVWKNNRSLLPQWWKDALDFGHPKREITRPRGVTS